MSITSASPLTPEHFQQVHKALSLWHQGAVRGSPLEQWLIVQQAQSETGGNLRLATNQVLHRALAILATHHADFADLLRVRFLDRKTVHGLAIERNVAEATIYFQQNQAIKLLTAVVHELEQTTRQSLMHSMNARLPAPSYVSLVGVSAHLERLLHLITSSHSPNLIVLEGLGGIGKTSLADALVRKAVELGSFHDVVWISAQQEFFRLDGSIRQIPRPALTPESLLDELSERLLGDRTGGGQRLAALQAQLARSPHLIVVDNLEMATDASQLFAVIRQLTSASRFLLLSRECYYDEPDAFHYRLGELTNQDALRLTRQEGARRNLPDLAEADDAELQPIFDTVGGNPLALRLIVGMVHAQPLPTVLSDLTLARGKPAAALYTYIYRRSWDGLDELCRQVLLVMPVVAESGGSAEFIAQVSALQFDQVCAALSVLVNRNLVDSRGNLQQRRYAIHNLTRSFLLEQVARWQA